MRSVMPDLQLGMLFRTF